MQLFLNETLQPDVISPSFVLLYQFISYCCVTHSLLTHAFIQDISIEHLLCVDQALF